jgi:methylated-DNA-[protein]-cysteine S-methyltransferase
MRQASDGPVYCVGIATPLGWVRIVTSEAGLRELAFTDDRPTASATTPPPLRKVAAWVAAYFAGDAPPFDGPLDLRGSAFEQRVWAIVRTIGFGQMRSYGSIARALGEPGAARAVGRANGRNPAALVVPCHRVVGADGSLTGYAGGLERKAALLAHEGGGLFGAAGQHPRLGGTRKSEHATGS